MKRANTILLANEQNLCSLTHSLSYLVTANDIGQRGGAEEVLLLQPQLASLLRLIVRIEHRSDVLSLLALTQRLACESLEQPHNVTLKQKKKNKTIKREDK
jgi:hypothetical protein